MEKETITREDSVLPVVNRHYKDTVFRKLFSEPKELLSLYNALNGTHYTDESELKIVTLEAAVYMSVKNDVAFVFDSSVMLYEHQATKSPNLPLRDLFYISAEYQKLIDAQEGSLYSKKRIMLPTPKFVVFYNGTDKQPERQTLKLSDSYEKKVSEPELELKVLILNINEGYNQGIKEQCQTLFEYCQFVHKIRTYAKIKKIRQAVEQAVLECIEANILREFLLANRAEVIAMSIFEYNEEEEMRKIRRDIRLEERAEGKAEGKVEAKVEDILKVLKRLGFMEPSVKQAILEEKDIKILERWFDLALEAESIDDFCQQVGLLEKIQ